MVILVNFDVMLAKRKMVCYRIIRKTRQYNGECFYLEKWKAKAAKFSTLEKICEVLDY